MPRYYFHQHLNGRVAEDQQGLQFADQKEACEHAGFPDAYCTWVRRPPDPRHLILPSRYPTARTPSV